MTKNFPGIYRQLRQVYRDLEQDRARVFYDLQKSESRAVELRAELKDIDEALNNYQLKIKQLEGGGE